MVLFAKRVSALRLPATSSSISPAVVCRRRESKMDEAFSRVSNWQKAAFDRMPSAKYQVLIAALVRRTDFDPAKPRRRRPVARAHHLLRLALAAVGRAPQGPLVARTDRVH